jgi:hypothetical protein
MSQANASETLRYQGRRGFAERGVALAPGGGDEEAITGRDSTNWA